MDPATEPDDLPGRPGPPAPRPWYAGRWAAAGAGLLVGVVVGVVAGLLLGGGDGEEERLVAVEEGSPTTGGEDAEAGEGEDAASEQGAGTTTATGELTVVVPEECIEVVDQAERALRLLNEGLGALSELDTEPLSDALDDVDDLRADVEALLEECRQEATTER